MVLDPFFFLIKNSKTLRRQTLLYRQVDCKTLSFKYAFNIKNRDFTSGHKEKTDNEFPPTEISHIPSLKTSQ